jgi:hypothetical protein
MKFAATRLDLSWGTSNPRDVHAIDYVRRHLRSEELYELSAVGATMEQFNDLVFASAVMGEGWRIDWDGTPAFLMGVTERHPGAYGLWGFGTKDCQPAMRSLTKWSLKTWLPDFKARTNFRRIEVRLPVSSVHSISWLKFMGMIPECTLPNYSVVGEDFIQLALTPGKTSGDYQHVLRTHFRRDAIDDGAARGWIGGGIDTYAPVRSAPAQADRRAH